jgi:hypothetical protein
MTVEELRNILDLLPNGMDILFDQTEDLLCPIICHRLEFFNHPDSGENKEYLVLF